MNKFTNNLPKSAVLELTYLCNHKCKFCSCPWENTVNPSMQYDKCDEVPIEDWKRILHILESAGVKRVTITGGEPLLKSGLDDLLHYIRANTKLCNNEKIILISNGRLMNESLLSLFKETGVHLSMSLPGLTTYPYHTGLADSDAGSVLYWLKRAKDENIPTTASITVTKQNIHELYETIANSLIAGADTILLNRFLVGGRGIEYQDDLALSQIEMLEMLDVAENVLAIANRVGSVGTEFPLCIIPGTSRNYEKLYVGSRCTAANGFFVIDPSGYVRTCNHSPRRVGHIFNEKIIDDTDYWQMFAERTFELPNMCAGCEDAYICDCGCREASSIYRGTLNAPDQCFIA